MNKIAFPLTLNMKDDTVVDLHAALKVLQLNVPEAETQERYYGEGTTAAVVRFQANNGLRETGTVDEETAHALNQALHDAGHLDDHDSYVVRGHIQDRSAKPVSGLLVRAVDMDPSGEDRLGEPVTTDEAGRYAIVYYDRQFRIDGRESGNADIVIRVFDPDASDNPLGKSSMHRNAPRELTIDLTVDYAPYDPPKDGDDDKFVVAGFLRWPDGRPAANARVRAFDVRLRRDHPLGEDQTARDGSYKIVYTRRQFRRGGKTAADLRVRAYDNGNRETAASDILFEAGEVEEVDLTVGNTAYRGPSEFDQLITLLEPRMRGFDFAELREDDEHQDVAFLSGNTGADARLIAFLIAARRLSARTGISSEIFYGLFRSDLPVNLPALLVQDQAVLSRSLELAIQDNIIPARFSAEIDRLPAQFKKLVVSESMRSQPQQNRESQTPLVTLLGTVLSDAKESEEFLKRYVNHAGPINEFWEDLRQSELLANKVDEVQFALQAAALTGNHGALIAELQSMRKEANPRKKISSLRDLARFDEFGWRTVLERPNGQGRIGAPANVPGADDDEKLANFARILARRVELEDPTAFIAARLEDDKLDGKANLLTFFRNNQDTFDITATRVTTYVRETPNALDGIADTDKTAVSDQLRTLQRLYNVAPSYGAMSALYKNGVKSAADIVAMGSAGFSLKYASAFGPGSTVANAQRVYARAESIHATAIALLAAHGLDGTHLSMHALNDEQPEPGPNTPDWATLFGSLELCTCTHCRSVYSPAAYLVDILHFLQQRRLVDAASIEYDDFGHIKPDLLRYLQGPNGEEWTAKDELFQRRPDLGEIELTCENTNTPLPYVDLVNEVLEDYVASRQNAARNRQTSGTPEELGANPQYLNPDAYEKLRRAVYPLTLPFDLWHAQARVYLEHLGVPDGQILETFLPGDRAALLADLAIGRRRLDLTVAEADLITGATTAEAGAAEPGVWNLWGFAKANLDPADSASAIPDPADSNGFIPADATAADTWLNTLTGRVDVYLQQSGLTYLEFLDLLGSYFVNPGSIGNRQITILAHDDAPVDTCETNSLRIDNMDQGAALRSLRFIRLWRKIGWSMRDLDRVLNTLLALNGVTAMDDVVLSQLSLIQRLHGTLRLPVEKLLPFWGPMDSARYLDHRAAGQPPYPTLYERLFRNRNVLNPPDPAFVDDPAALSGSLAGHDATVGAALGTTAAELAALRLDTDVIPLKNGQLDDDLSQGNLARLVRHATLAKALRLPVADYLTALKLHGDPFVDPGTTVLFVEYVHTVLRSALTFAELDYLSRHRIVEPTRVAPTDEEISLLLTAMRSELQRIAAQNTFVDGSNDMDEPTVDLQGDLTRQKLGLLGWPGDLIDEVMAALNSGDSPASRDFVRRNMRRYTTETFETPLDTLPGTVSFPAALAERIYHDAAAGKLHFVGAMRNAEREALLGLSTESGYRTAIGALFAAPDVPPQADVFLTSSGPGSDIAVLFDEPDMTPAERFQHVLSKLMPHLRDVLSERAVTQMLAEVLDVEMQTADDLLTTWLDWAGHPGEKLAAGFREPSFVDSNADLPITRAGFAEQFDAYLRLHKVALIAERFEATPGQVGWLFKYASAAGWPNLPTLPLTPQTAAAEPLEAWLRLIELFALRDTLPRGEEMLDDLLSKAAAVDGASPAADKDAAKEAYVAALVQWTGWSPIDLEVLLGTGSDHSETGLLDAVFPGDYAGAHLLVRLAAGFALLKRLGMSAAQCRDLATKDVDQSISEMVKQAARARHDEAQWLEITKPLRNALREQQRRALAAYTLAHPDQVHRWRDASDIYSYFLLDVEMDPCMMTSRIKQAISSVQLFVQRCLMNLEANVLASAEVDGRWRDWRWMKNYRVWEANRKIFLYPENWIEPELRDDKTPFFLELESDLLQNDLTYETAEAAFRSYLGKLDDVARLEIAGMYRQQEDSVLHVFGRTSGVPHTYFYRRLANDGTWTPWEPVDLDIQGDHLVPVVWQGRLHLIWPIFTELPSRETTNQSVKSSYWEIQLARSSYQNGSWTPKRVSESFVSTRSRDLGEDLAKLIFKGISYPDRLEVRIADVEVASRGFAQRRERAAVGAGNLSPIRERFNPTSVFFMVSGTGGGLTGDGLRDPLGGMVGPEIEDAVFEPIDTWWQYYFRLSGCNGDFVVIREPLAPLTDIPTELVPEHNWLQPASSANNRLYLPKTRTQAGVALDRLSDSSGQRISGAGVRILYPHQEPGFAGLLSGPWFFNGEQRTYFVTVRQPLRINIWDQPLVEPVDTLLGYSFAPTPGDPFDPFLAGSRMAPAVNPGDPLLFAELASGTLPLPALEGNLPNATTPREPRVSSSRARLALAIARDHLATAGVTTLPILRPFGQYRYTFHTFYHPHVCTFIEALNRNGIDGLLQRPLQLRSDEGESVFEQAYQPRTGNDRLVSGDYPVETVDFGYSSPYSQYNWELFFHAPMLIANSLRQNQRFEDAQRWFHYIFDPTDKSGLPAPQRYWRTKPFYQKSPQEYQRQQIPLLLRLLASGGDVDKLNINDGELKAALLADYDDLVISVRAWRAAPFMPHGVARMRTTAYQKAVVMKYIDNLIAWGDQLFRRDTIESINEASQLYIMAADMLGKRPEQLPPRAVPQVHTYNTLAPLLDEFSNGLAEIEEFVPPSVAIGPVETDTPLPSPLTMLYFCVPKNDELLAYWDIVGDRLFKIRHCMNIEGVVRQLPLFEPPIDPALLVRAAAAGIDLASVLNDVSAPLPHYRFNVLAQKATELCNEVKSLGGTLLATLEKRDAEKLALLRAEHETALLQLVEQVREQQRDEANQQVEALRASRNTVVTRYLHYQRLLGSQDLQVPPAGEAIAEQEAFEQASTGEQIGIRMTSSERSELNRMEEAKAYSDMAAEWENLANVLYYVPTYVQKAFFGEIEYGGVHLGHAATAVAAYRRQQMSDKNHRASVLARTGQYIMRQNDWVLQRNEAAKDIMGIDQQIIAADLRKAIAEQELDNHRAQVEQARRTEEVLRNKFTNQELYTWMIGQISTVYFQAYQLAYDVAKRAERAFRYELGLQDSGYVRFGYWDSLKKGLLAGERLHQDLKRMEVAYLDQNKREYEITKHVSLRQLDPGALLELKATGGCEVILPEWLFDLDAPGHYLRRIKNVRLSIPSVTGPFTSVNCTLTLLKSTVRRSPQVNGQGYGRQQDSEDSRFVDSYVVQSIVTSTGNNDSGMFETNLRDERFLPFEGHGAISTWRLELPVEFRQFDYNTISDVVIHVGYTARPGGSSLGDGAREHVRSLVEDAQTSGLAQLFSLRHDFPNEWHHFVTGDGGFVATIKKEHFPYLVQGKKIEIDGVELYVLEDGTLQSGDTGGVSTDELTDGLQDDNQAEISLTEDTGLVRDRNGQAFLVARYSLQ